MISEESSKLDFTHNIEIGTLLMCTCASHKSGSKDGRGASFLARVFANV